MHPRRWAWITAALDTAGRPLVVPQGRELNSIAVFGAPTAQGAVGSLAGLPIHTTANIPNHCGRRHRG
jgi:hypothetical protein